MLRRQKSFVGDIEGCLYLVATPIGNLEDITYRAVRILNEVDIIACEDTRVTRKLLTHFEINKPLISYHEYNKEKSGEKVIELLEDGKKVALVSDAGVPCISDPGFDIVRDAIEEGLPVVPIPGASAGISALISSGLLTHKFMFYGFLDRKKKRRCEQLAALINNRQTMIFYESPHRVKETLEDMIVILGDRKVVLAREMTKKFEEFLRGTISDILTVVTELKGEMVIVVEGSDEDLIVTDDLWWEEMSIEQHVEKYMMDGHKRNDAIKLVAKDRHTDRRSVYNEFHNLNS